MVKKEKRSAVKCSNCLKSYGKAYYLKHKCSSLDNFQMIISSNSKYYIYRCVRCQFTGRRFQAKNHNCNQPRQKQKSNSAPTELPFDDGINNISSSKHSEPDQPSIIQLVHQEKRNRIQSQKSSISMEIDIEPLEKAKKNMNVTWIFNANHLVESQDNDEQQLNCINNSNIISQCESSSSQKSMIEVENSQQQEQSYYKHEKLSLFRRGKSCEISNIIVFKCEMLVYGLFLRLSMKRCPSTGEIMERCRFISRFRYDRTFAQFFPWLLNPRFSPLMKQAIDNVCNVHRQHYEIKSFDTLFLLFRDKVEHSCLSQKFTESIFDKPLPQRFKKRLRRCDPSTEKQRRAYAVWKCRQNKKFFNRNREYTVLKHQMAKNNFDRINQNYRRRQWFSHNPKPHQRRYYDLKRKQIMVQFGLESVADWLTAHWLLKALSTPIFLDKKAQKHNRQSGIMGKLCYQQCSSLTEWLPVCKEFLIRQRPLFLPIYNSIQQYFYDEIPPLTEEELFKKVVKFYQEKLLLRYQTMAELNDSIINYDKNKEEVARQLENLSREVPSGKDNPFAYGAPKGTNSDEELDVEVRVKEPIKGFFPQETKVDYSTVTIKKMEIERSTLIVSRLDLLSISTRLIVSNIEDYRACSFCCQWLQGQIIECNLCSNEAHKDCYLGFCNICSQWKPSITTGFASSITSRAFPASVIGLIKINPKRITTIDTYVFEGNKRLIQKKGFNYSFWNEIEQNSTFYPSYNPLLRSLHQDDEKILRQIEKNQIPQAIIIESQQNNDKLVATTTFAEGEFICMLSGSIVSATNITKHYAKEKNRFFQKVIDGPSQSTTYGIILLKNISFGSFCRVSSIGYNSKKVLAISLQGPIVTLVASKIIESGEEVVCDPQCYYG